MTAVQMNDVWTPVFRVVADGADVTARMADRLVSLTVTDEKGSTSDTVRIVLDDRDAVFELPPTGATLAVGIGYKESGGPVDMGVYVVDELHLEGPERRFEISGKAADSLDKKAPGRMKATKSRSWHGKTLGQLVDAVASEHGFEAVVGPEFRDLDVGHIDQTEESDLNLLRRLADDNGAVVKPASGKLLFVKEGTAKTASGKAMPAITLGLGQCSRWSWKTAKRQAAGAVTAQWHDKDGAELQEVTSGSGEPSQTIGHTYASKAEAERAAASGLERAKRGEVSVDLECVGDPALVAEASLTLSGFRAAVDGAYVIKSATHTLTSTSYVTSVAAELPKPEGGGGSGDDEED